MTQLNKVYSFSHTEYTVGVNFYRVAMIQYSGQRKYSVVEKVIVKEKDSIQLGPNPAGNTIRLYSGNLTGMYSIDLFDNAGRLLRTWELVTPGESLDLHWLKPGIYIARIRDRRKLLEFKNLRIVKE